MDNNNASFEIEETNDMNNNNAKSEIEEAMEGSSKFAKKRSVDIGSSSSQESFNLTCDVLRNITEDRTISREKTEEKGREILTASSQQS
ncbi:hypothetical protein L484_006872 [Morus notabilis]|uniref:Uncharacterized protein n=1 Tax=Morus notabilis TaxID=981085 RepID=W9SL17_9ROSA|nr:hypothetical protein L484_006872 [Morus notabilis]